jgi:hypothetical protein
MRKLFIATAMLLSSFLYGQDATKLPFTYNCIVRVSPMNFFWNNFQVGLEIPFNISNALLIMPNVTYNQHKSGVGLELQYKYYVINKFQANGTSCNKIYVGLYGLYRGFSYDNVTGHRAGSGGIIAGYNYVFFKRFHVDVYIGGGIRGSDGSTDDFTDIGYKGIVPRIGLDFGINY